MSTRAASQTGDPHPGTVRRLTNPVSTDYIGVKSGSIPPLAGGGDSCPVAEGSPPWT